MDRKNFTVGCVLFLILFFCVNEYSFSQQITWSRTYGDTGSVSEQGVDILQTYDGNYVVLAARSYDGNNQKILLLKLDTHGNVMWEKMVADSIVHHSPYRFQQTKDSGFIITGVSGSAFLIKTDKNGNLEWRKIYTDTYPQTYSFSVITTTDNGFVFCGDVPFFNPPSDKGYIVKTDSVGNIQWERVYEDSLFTAYGQIIHSNDSNFLYALGGTNNITQPLTKYTTVRKIKLNGDEIWMKTFAANSGGSSFLQIDDTSLIINSRTSMSILRDPFFKIDTSGNLIWLNRYQNPSTSGFPVIICKDNQNNIQKVGDYFNNIAYSKISPSGQQLILRPYQMSGFLATAANVIKNCVDGGFIIIGIAASGTQSHPKVDLLILKTDSAGISPLLAQIFHTNLEVPSEFYLYQNYPNPFNSNTIIKFNIPKYSHIRIVIYNVLGKEVSVLVNQDLNPGNYMMNFDASTNLTSGIYYYTMQSNSLIIDSKQMILIK